MSENQNPENQVPENQVPETPVQENPVQGTPMQQMPVNAGGGKGMAIASMVLGIVAIALYCFIYVSIPCAIVGVILAAISLKKGGEGRGMAIAGLVLGVIAVAFTIIMTVVGGAALASFGKNADTLQNDLDQLQSELNQLGRFISF